MRQLVYTLRFTGRLVPVDDAPDRLRARTRAAGCTVTTRILPEGVRVTVEIAPGEAAICDAELTFTGETTFRAAGTIAFGGPHLLRFRTLGQGHLGPSADPRLRYGGALWAIAGGQGQFAGAGGTIASNFTLDADGTITDHHCAVLFIA